MFTVNPVLELTMESTQKRTYTVVACLFIALGGVTFYVMNTKHDLWVMVMEAEEDAMESELNAFDVSAATVSQPTSPLTALHATLDLEGDRLRTVDHKLSALDQFKRGSGQMVMFHYSGGCKGTSGLEFHHQTHRGDP